MIRSEYFKDNRKTQFNSNASLELRMPRVCEVAHWTPDQVKDLIKWADKAEGIMIDYIRSIREIPEAVEKIKNPLPQNFENEIWVDVQGYEAFYAVSNMGRVTSKPGIFTDNIGRTRKYNGKILSGFTSDKYYPHVDLKGSKTSIHRLVAKHFIPNPENKRFINHKDGNKHNNKVENLEWCTPGENIVHGKYFNLSIAKTGKNKQKIDENDILEMRRRYDAGESLDQIHNHFSTLGRSQIYRIIKRKSWKLIG